jgi:hypothetical protein
LFLIIYIGLPKVFFSFFFGPLPKKSLPITDIDKGEANLIQLE